MNPSPTATSDFAEYAKRLSARTACLGSALAVAGLLISRPVALGMLLGVAAGVIKLRLTARGLLRFADMDSGLRERHLIRQRVLRYFFVGAVLLAAFATDRLNQWAALAGVLLPNVVIVADTLLSARLSSAPDVDQAA